MTFTIYQMIDTETGEIIPYAEWQERQRRTCGGLLPDDQVARDPPRPPIPQAVRPPHPGDRLAAIFFSLEK